MATSRSRTDGATGSAFGDVKRVVRVRCVEEAACTLRSEHSALVGSDDRFATARDVTTVSSLQGTATQ